MKQLFEIETKSILNEDELLGCLEDTISNKIISVRKIGVQK